jgi:DNA-binding transcriptional regulator YiaG
MTPAEFREIRHALGLSAEGMARVLRVSSGRTVRWWESGGRPITGPVELAMELLSILNAHLPWLSRAILKRASKPRS